MRVTPCSILLDRRRRVGLDLADADKIIFHGGTWRVRSLLIVDKVIDGAGVTATATALCQCTGKTVDMIIAFPRTLAHLADSAAHVDQQSTARALNVSPSQVLPSQVMYDGGLTVSTTKITVVTGSFSTHPGREFEKHNRLKPFQ
jgi:hypothetical protein